MNPYLMQTIFAGLAALIHVYIFVLESFLWQKPKARRVFGMSESDVKTTKDLAFNQGFYNLFLAMAIFAGFYLHQPILTHYAMLSIAAAGLVLLISKPKLFRGALIQLVPAGVYFLFVFLA